jgi:hypothetical protein
MISFKIFVKIVFFQVLLAILYFIFFHRDSNIAYVGKNSYSQELFGFIKKCKIFLIDIEVLKEIEGNLSQVKLKENVTFGIIEDDLKQFIRNKHIFEDYFNCELSKMNNRETNIFILCNHSLTIQIAIFYPRNDYFWIGQVN